MGILGLTSYINQRSKRYLRYHELHDTYLLIDGGAISCEIYDLYGKYDSACGSVYDKYARNVSYFFDSLLKCNITPLVYYKCDLAKKLLPSIKSLKQHIQEASSFSPFDKRKAKCYPLLRCKVFGNVLREKNIRRVQCLLEDNKHIAAIARILNCPILSNNSDFYVYGSMYIPLDTLCKGVFMRSNGREYIKRCKIYKIEYLLNSFSGLQESMLPLAATLLDKDCAEHGLLENFFDHVKLKRASKESRYVRHDHIEAIFTWLSHYEHLDMAITNILIRVPIPSRQSLLNLIENNINNYINASTDAILISLGFSKDYGTGVNMLCPKRSFKFNGDINTITYIGEDYEREKDKRNEEEDEDVIQVMNTIDDDESLSLNEAISNLPEWFINEYRMSKFSPFFMKLIIRRLYKCHVQIENDKYPSSNIIGLKIISVIFGLLKSAINDEVRYLRCVIRDKNRIVLRELQGTETLNCCKLPSLSDLREIPLSLRTEILNETLGINSTDCIDEFPPEWKLYFGCIKYWTREQEPFAFHKANIYAILIGMFFHLIDSKIGLYRTIDYFEEKKGKAVEAIKQKRETNNYKPHYTTNGTVIEAYSEVDYEDCHLAASFFISHFGIDKKLRNLNRTILHAFAEFQVCLSYAMSLNALLDYPYPHTVIANFFHGTLLYNLSDKFKTQQDIEKYINDVLGMSPSLLRLFHILLSKIKSTFPLLFQDEVDDSAN